jgi:hypothetical protein
METKNVPFSPANLKQKLSAKAVLGGLVFALGLLALFSSVQFGWPFSSWQTAFQTAKANVVKPTAAAQAAAIAPAPLEIAVTGPAARGWKFGAWSKNGGHITGIATFNPLAVERLLNATTGSIVYTAYQDSNGNKIKLDEESVSMPALSAGETGRIEFYVPDGTNAIVLTVDYAEPGAAFWIAAAEKVEADKKAEATKAPTPATDDGMKMVRGTITKINPPANGYIVFTVHSNDGQDVTLIAALEAVQPEQEERMVEVKIEGDGSGMLTTLKENHQPLDAYFKSCDAGLCFSYFEFTPAEQGN